MIKALGADAVTTRMTLDPGGSAAQSIDPNKNTAAAAQPFYKDPVTYAVAGGAVLAAIGGAMLLKKRRK